MTTLCDVIDNCIECPRYGDDCDGDKKTEHTDLISRADAIEAWDKLSKRGRTEFDQVLMTLPSAELPKGDLISRQWLLEVYGDYIGDNGETKYYVPLEVVRQNIKDAPSADAVQGAVPTVVRVTMSDGSQYYLEHERDAIQADTVSREFYEDAVKANIRLVIENGKLKEQIESAEAVQGWRIGKPTEQGKYIVTLDSFGHKHIDLFYYGKPMMPNRRVRGKCWYRSDDEWGDVVYDDTDILAWQPLPKPYKGGEK